MVEPAELSEIVTGDGSCWHVVGLKKLHEFGHELEVLHFESLDIFFPEVLTVAWSPTQFVGGDFLVVFFEA